MGLALEISSFVGPCEMARADSADSPLCVNLGVIRIWIGIKMESRIWIGANIMPIHNTGGGWSVILQIPHENEKQYRPKHLV